MNHYNPQLQQEAYDKLAALYETRPYGAVGNDISGMTATTIKIGRQEYIFYNAKASNYRSEIVCIHSMVGQSDNFEMLDICSGTGDTLYAFASGEYTGEIKYKTTGVDFSKEMCKIARAKSPESEVIWGNIFDQKFQPNRFDVITFMSGPCQFLKSDARKLMEMIKIWLKPTGRIYISTSVEQNENVGLVPKKALGLFELPENNIIRYRENYTIPSLIKLTKSAGLKIDMSFLINPPAELSGVNRVFQGHICHVKS